MICEVCGKGECDFTFTDGTRRYGVHFKCGEIVVEPLAAIRKELNELRKLVLALTPDSHFMRTDDSERG